MKRISIVLAAVVFASLTAVAVNVSVEARKLLDERCAAVANEKQDLSCNGVANEAFVSLLADPALKEESADPEKSAAFRDYCVKTCERVRVVK